MRGASALRPLDRLAVVLSFAGAAWYVVARYLTIPSPSSNVFPLSLLWSATFLALVVSAAAVAGVVSVPLVRAARTRKRWRKLGEGTFFLGLLAAAGLLGFLWVLRNNSLQEALTAYHSTWAPPSTLLWIVAAAGGFQVASSLNSFLKWTGPLLRATDSHVSRLSVILGTIGAVLAGYAAVQVLAPSIDHWGVETVLALLALVAPLALAIYLDLPVLAWRSLKQAWSAIKLGWATLERAARRGR